MYSWMRHLVVGALLIATASCGDHTRFVKRELPHGLMLFGTDDLGISSLAIDMLDGSRVLPMEEPGRRDQNITRIGVSGRTIAGEVTDSAKGTRKYFVLYSVREIVWVANEQAMATELATRGVSITLVPSLDFRPEPNR